MNDLIDGQNVFGYPAIDVKARLKSFAVTKKLPEMARQLHELVRKVNKLEAAEDNKKPDEACW